MPYLIDGYNLLFALGMPWRGRSDETLRAARRYFLDYLAKSLTIEEARETLVVFDAKHAPRGAAPEEYHGAIRVIFAHRHDEADDMLEELIRREPTPERLTLITSDLRIREAARRRRIRSIKSDDWLVQLSDRRAGGTHSAAASAPADPHSERQVSGEPRMPDEPELSDEEVARWLDEFRTASHQEPKGVRSVRAGRTTKATTETTPAEPGSDRGIKAILPRVNDASAPPISPEVEPRIRLEQRDEEQRDRNFDWGPFPPGYGEDLLRDETDQDDPGS